MSDVFKYLHMTQYNTTTQEVNIYDKVSLVELAAPNLWEVDQCFDQHTYLALKNIPDQSHNSFACGGLKKRFEMTFASKDYDWLCQIGQDMCQGIGKITGHELRFITAKYWLDTPTFGCQTHFDAEDIFVSYQVYLSSALTDEIRHPDHIGSTANMVHYLDTQGQALVSKGATFLHCDPPVQIKFAPNHGYINLNSDLKPHRVDGSWDTRISVMFQYARV